MWDHVKADLVEAVRCVGDAFFHVGQAFKSTLASQFGEPTANGLKFRGTYYRVPMNPHDDEPSL